MSETYLFCSVCETRSTRKCGRCHMVAYCSKEHQKLDWKDHKNICKLVAGKCYEIAKNDVVGRHMIATRYIAQGETIFEETPLVTGPAHGSPPVCLGCYKFLERGGSIVKCSRCNWPLCSRSCEQSAFHVPECEITAQYKKERVNITNFEISHPTYRSIITLRSLYLSKWNKDAWDKITSLESHADDRRNTERYRIDLVTVGEFIPSFYNYHEFSEDEIMRMAGIVAMNSFHVPMDSPGFAAIYHQASMLEHSCYANCSQNFYDDGRIAIRAGRAIHKGEHLSISYIFPLWAKQARQDRLFTARCFSCICERCSDPTDMGTNFDSFHCFSPGCTGYIAPRMGDVPLRYHWECTECHKLYKENGPLGKLCLKIRTEATLLDKTCPQNCKEFLEKYKKILPPNNFFMFYVKLAYLSCYEGENLTSASIAELQNIIATSRGVIDLVTKLVPSDTTVKGVLYFLLYSALVEARAKMTASGQISTTELNENLAMSRDILKKSYSMLSSPEKEILFGSLKNVKDVAKLLQNVVETTYSEMKMYALQRLK